MTIATGSGNAVVFDGVTKVFDTGDTTFTALEDITFAVPAGGISGVVGTSGAGKSTLIRTVNGLETPTTGTVSVLGEEPAKLNAKQLRDLRRKVSMVFQNYNLLETKTVAENVATPLLLAKTPKAEMQRRVAEALEMVGLSERAGHKPRQLSAAARRHRACARHQSEYFALRRAHLRPGPAHHNTDPGSAPQNQFGARRDDPPDHTPDGRRGASRGRGRGTV